MGNYTTSYTIDKDGNPISLSAYTSGGCKNNTITLNKVDEENWFYFTSATTAEGVKITVSANTSDGNTHSCKLIPTINDKQCNAITFTQESDCDCPHNEVWSNIIVLPQSGVGNSDSDWYLCYQSRYESISEECIDELSVDTEGAAHYANSEFKIEKNQDPNSANTIDVYVKNVSSSKIFKSDEINLKYGDKLCDEMILVEQSGTVECTCEGTEQMITVIETRFTANGTDGNFVTFASGRTYGCGELELRVNVDNNNSQQEGDDTEPPMLEDWKTETEQIGNDIFYTWKCKISPLGKDSPSQKTVGFDIYFKDNEGSTFIGCGRGIYLLQDKITCGCPIIENPNQSYTYTLPDGKYYSSYSLESTYGEDEQLLTGFTLQELTYITGGEGYTCNWIVATSDCDWITILQTRCTKYTLGCNLTGIQFIINRNDTGAERSCVIKLHGYEGFYRGQSTMRDVPFLNQYYYTIAYSEYGKDCGEIGEITLIQPEDEVCDCGTNSVSGTNVETLSSKVGSVAIVDFIFISVDDATVCAEYSDFKLVDSNGHAIDWAVGRKLEGTNSIEITRTAVTDNDEVIKVRIHYTVDNGVECYGDIEVNTIGCSCDDIVGNVNTKGIVLAQTGGTERIPLGELGHLFSDCYEDNYYKTNNQWNIYFCDENGDRIQDLEDYWARNLDIKSVFTSYNIVFDYDATSEERILYIAIESSICGQKIIQLQQKGPSDPCVTCNPLWNASNIEVIKNEVIFSSRDDSSITPDDMFRIPSSGEFEDETCNNGTVKFNFSSNVPNYFEIITAQTSNNTITYSVKPNSKNETTTPRSYYYIITLVDENGVTIKDARGIACNKSFHIYQFPKSSCGDCSNTFFTNIEIDTSRVNNIIESDDEHIQYYEVATLPSLTENCFEYRIVNEQTSVIDVRINGDKVEVRGMPTEGNCHSASFSIQVMNLTTGQPCYYNDPERGTLGGLPIYLKIKASEEQQCDSD